jgi:tetratricopeptide (TPR) repeat protein
MSGRFADNPAYVKYETLLKQLHALIAAGNGQGPEADAVREAMDEPVARLNRAEILRLKGLSADLYMLQGREVLATDSGPTLELHELQSELNHFRTWNSWDAVLDLLRRRAPTIPDVAVAATRARAYAALGHADTALLFLDFAFKAAPDDPDYKALRLMLLLDAGRNDEATRTAESILASNSTSPNLVFAAADVLFASAAQSQGRDADAEYARVLDVLNRLVGGRGATGRLLPSFLVLAHLLRAGCLSHFRKIDEGIRACDEALAVAPNDSVVLQVRSLLQTGSIDGTLQTAMSTALNRYKASMWPAPILTAA